MTSREHTENTEISMFDSQRASINGAGLESKVQLDVFGVFRHDQFVYIVCSDCFVRAVTACQRKRGFPSPLRLPLFDCRERPGINIHWVSNNLQNAGWLLAELAVNQWPVVVTDEMGNKNTELILQPLFH